METGNESSYTGQVSKLKKAIRKILIGVVVLAILVIGFVGWSFYAAIYKWQSPLMATVEIEEGLPVSVIAEKLAENQVIKTPRIFSAFVRIRGLSSQLKAGEYEFPGEITADQVISMLVKGQVKKYQLQIIEGWTIKDIVKYLSEIRFLKDPNIPADFLRLTSDKAYIESLGFKDLNSLEGYLFPDTYEVYRPKSADEIIKRLVAHFREIYTPECTALADKLQMSQNQIVTFASIIEKETGKALERPIIASVFYNRLKQNMALQSDPTVIYGIPDFNGNLTRENLDNGANPYNTYMHLGLTPGPICNPGKASIEAALQPATTKYLYFVSKNNGSHVFSETLEEHQRAVAQYQLGKAFAAAGAGSAGATSGEVEPPPGVTAIPPLVAPKGGAAVPSSALPPAAPGAPPALPVFPAPPATPPAATAPDVSPAAPQAIPGPSMTPPASPPAAAAPAPEPTAPAPVPSTTPGAPVAPTTPTLPKMIPAAPPIPSPTTPSAPSPAPAPTTPAPTTPAPTTPAPTTPTPTTPVPAVPKAVAPVAPTAPASPAAPAPAIPPPVPTPVVPPPAAAPAAPTPPATAPVQ